MRSTMTAIPTRPQGAITTIQSDNDYKQKHRELVSMLVRMRLGREDAKDAAQEALIQDWLYRQNGKASNVLNHLKWLNAVAVKRPDARSTPGTVRGHCEDRAGRPAVRRSGAGRRDRCPEASGRGSAPPSAAGVHRLLDGRQDHAGGGTRVRPVRRSCKRTALPGASHSVLGASLAWLRDSGRKTKRPRAPSLGARLYATGNMPDVKANRQRLYSVNSAAHCQCVGGDSMLMKKSVEKRRARVLKTRPQVRKTFPPEAELRSLARSVIKRQLHPSHHPARGHDPRRRVPLARPDARKPRLRGGCHRRGPRDDRRPRSANSK